MTNQLDSSLPSCVVSVLQKFDDDFLEEISKGLPHIRGLEHQIDFILGTTIPNMLAYWITPEETKELQRHVNELMGKEYVRESMSQYAAPVICFFKKMELGECALIVELSINQGKVSTSYFPFRWHVR